MAEAAGNSNSNNTDRNVHLGKNKMNINRFILACIIILILIPLASASDWDNIKSYNPIEKQVTIYNWNVIGQLFNLKLAEYKLISNTEQCLINCEATGIAVLYSDGQLFNDIKFLDTKLKLSSITNSQFLIEQSYQVDVIDYKEVCSDIKVTANLTTKTNKECTSVQSGTHKETKKRYVLYKNEILKAGTYNWKIVGTKSPFQSVDWVANAYGKDLNEWAWWNSTWAYRIRIDLKDYDVSLINMTKYIEIPYNVHMQSTYNDLRFASETTELPFDFDWKDSSTAGVWIRIDGLTSAYIYMYYGNVAAVAGNSSTLTFAGIRNVLHFNNMTNLGTDDIWNSTGTISYRTSPLMNSTGSVDADASGWDSNSGYLELLNQNWTMNVWASVNSSNQAEFLTTSKTGGNVGGVECAVTTAYCGAGLRLCCAAEGSGWTSCGSVTAGQTIMATLKHNTTMSYCYLNGVPQASFGNNVGSEKAQARLGYRELASPASRLIGNITDYQYYFNVKETMISDNKIAALYQNFNSSSYSFGTEAVNSSVPTYTVYAPLTNFTTLTLPLNVTLNISWSDIGGLNNCSVNITNNATLMIYPCGTNPVLSFNLSGQNYIYAYANNTIGNSNSTTIPFWIYFLNNVSSNATSHVTEGSTSNYWIDINMTGITNYIVNAWLRWNNTDYGSGTQTTLASDVVRFNKTLVVPSAGTTPANFRINWTWYYNITGSAPANISGNQNYTNIFFGPCDGNLTKKVLNLSFMDETTGAYINATMDASSWAYSIDSTSKTFTFANATHNKEYDFCIYPSFVPYVTSSETLQYSHSESGTYPQRKMVYNETYFNTTLTAKTLYLLNFNNGITSNYQVITMGNQVISGVYIKVERVISGSLVKITDGYTDNAGTISFFLNPNYDHILTISKTGYVTQTQTIKPTQGTYTITLGTASTYFNYVSRTEGISWVIYPPSGILESGMYNFSLYVSSRSSNIYNCSFNIKYLNGTIYNSTYGCNSSYPNMGSGGSIAKMINFTARRLLIGEYFITLENNTLIKLEGDARWREVNINKSYYGTSIISAINESLNMPEWGGNCPDGYTINQTDLYCYANDGSGDKLWNQTTDFNRIVFFFLFFAIILAIINFYTGYDTAYPGAFIIIMTIVVLILTGFNGIAGPGWFYLYGAANSDFFCASSIRVVGNSCDYISRIIENWMVAFHFVLLSIIYLATTMKRYQTG